MKKKLKIAIIDSGVCRDHPAFSGDVLQGVQVTPSGVLEDYADEYGHGTAIYGILRKCQEIADIVNIKIAGIQDGIESSLLVKALEYARDHVHADLINLSLGLELCEDIDALQAVIDDIYMQGTIIVSAFSNSGSFSYPAVFHNVIGVRSGNSCRNADDFEYIDDNILNIGARGALHRVCWRSPNYAVMGGNSFACAYTTAQAARFIAGGTLSLDDLLKKFDSTSKTRYTAKKHIMPTLPFTIRRAAVFPFSKEMHALLRFSHLLPFQVVDVYASKYSAHVGASTAHLLKEKSAQDVCIKNIANIDWDAFDTLIFGHMDELSNLVSKHDMRRSLFEQAISKGKNIYSFDEIPKEYIQISNHLFCPCITEENVPSPRFGMLYRCSKPVVGVFGTSSKQGKFTLQLCLREKLINLGYNVGQIGTEPHSALFSIDITFPIGYNSTVQINDSDSIVYLNYCLNELCMAKHDIILVGSQSGCVAYDTGNLQYYLLMQNSFLLGTLPDAVVLCVNPYDDVEYIQRSIQYIEATAMSKVFALVVFPMNINTNWTSLYDQKKVLTEDDFLVLRKKLYSRFGVPVYRLGDDAQMDLLVNDLIDFF